MKAYLIDPVAKTVTEVDTTGELDSVYALTQCDMVEQVMINTQRDIVLIDEEACYKNPEALGMFRYADYPAMLGRGLVLGTYGAEWGVPKVTLEALRELVSFEP
jgi:hypothetical protein